MKDILTGVIIAIVVAASLSGGFAFVRASQLNSTAAMCRGLDLRMEVWKMCEPSKGCMASFTEVHQLAKDAATCRKLEVAP